MATKPRICVICKEIIEDSLDGHMGPCLKSSNGQRPHVLHKVIGFPWPKEAQDA